MENNYSIIYEIPANVNEVSFYLPMKDGRTDKCTVLLQNINTSERMILMNVIDWNADEVFSTFDSRNKGHIVVDVESIEVLVSVHFGDKCNTVVVEPEQIR